MKLDYIYLHSQRPTICRTILLICTAWNIWTDVGPDQDHIPKAGEGFTASGLQDLCLENPADC